MNPNPYAADLGDKDPMTALAETPQEIARLLDAWSGADFDRSYAPGKWSARRILAHLAQAELALGTRVRFALAEDNDQAQAFNQDDWMPLDDHMDARTALDAFAHDDVPYALWGEFVTPAATRKNVRGMLTFAAPLLWNVSLES